MIVAFETLVKHHPKIRQKGDFIGLFDKKITAATVCSGDWKVFGSTEPAPAGADLAGEGNDAVMGGIVSGNAFPDGVNFLRQHQQAHAAGKLPLDRPGGRGDAGAEALAFQQFLEGKSLGIVGEQDVIVDLFGHISPASPRKPGHGS